MTSRQTFRQVRDAVPPIPANDNAPRPTFRQVRDGGMTVGATFDNPASWADEYGIGQAIFDDAEMHFEAKLYTPQPVANDNDKPEWAWMG